VITVKNKIVWNGKAFYLLKNGKEGEITGFLTIFLKNKKLTKYQFYI